MFNLINLLADKIDLINIGDVNFIGKFLRILIEAVGSVGIAVILFTLIIKVIVLPLDIFSRASMKKNSLKMKRLQPQLEKMKKQYGNNKQLYNQKMAEMYKKEGYSMFGACLPMIVSLVFFIVVLNAFSAYSRFSVAENYNEVVSSYNCVITKYDETAANAYELTDGGYNLVYLEKIAEYTPEKIEELAQAEKAKEYNKVIESYQTNNQGKTPEEIELLAVEAANLKYDETIAYYSPQVIETIAKNAAASKYLSDNNDIIVDEALSVARDTYYGNEDGFLWIKNIWISDNPFKKAVPTQQQFESLTGYKIDKADYDHIMAKMDKEPVNGYFIMTILCVGVTLVSQLVMNKTQKAQMEAQMSGKGMNKMMMIIMPIMMGVFSLNYSGAFSLYIIISSAYSTLSTLLINKVVELRFKKKLEMEEAGKYKRPTNRNK